MSSPQTKYEVIRDQREKANVWNFPPSNYCVGTTEAFLLSGDYTIKGLENVFTIERKASTGELSGNITDPAFERELDRMDKMEHSFLIFEFTLDDVYKFPYNSSIPSKIWPKLKVSSNYIIKRLIEIETNHKVKVIFAGDKASDYAQRIFKEMNTRYAKS